MVTVVNQVKWNLLNASIINIALKIVAYIVTETQTQNWSKIIYKYLIWIFIITFVTLIII